MAVADTSTARAVGGTPKVGTRTTLRTTNCMVDGAVDVFNGSLSIVGKPVCYLHLTPLSMQG